MNEWDDNTKEDYFGFLIIWDVPQIADATGLPLKTTLSRFLWLARLTGFWMEIAVTFGGDIIVNQVVFIIHTIISMELVLLFAFSKFAHAMYRPLALYFHFIKN